MSLSDKKRSGYFDACFEVPDVKEAIKELKETSRVASDHYLMRLIDQIFGKELSK